MREWEGSRIPLIQREDPTVRWAKAVPGIFTNFSENTLQWMLLARKKLSSCLIAFFPLCPGVESGPPALGFQGLNSSALPASLV